MNLFAQLRFFLARRRGRLVAEGRVTLAAPLVCNGAGRVTLGDRTTVGVKLAPRTGDGAVMLQARTRAARIIAGDGCVFSNGVSVIARVKVTFGRDCLIGDGALIMDSDFHRLEPGRRLEKPDNDSAVVLGDCVWIGSRAIVLKGVIIGDNAVVAAGAVVVKSVPANTVVVGNPARVVKTIVPS